MKSRGMGGTGTLAPRRSLVVPFTKVPHRFRGHQTLTRASGKESWDFGRFVQTVLYFNPPPSISDAVRGLFSPKLQSEVRNSYERQAEDFVVVTGATGGVGANVVASLLRNGRNVRAVVRNLEKADKLLANLPRAGQAKLEIVKADITDSSGLPGSIFKQASSVVSATSTIIGPKEGDTNDRQKYRQGIKFFEPEVKGLRPEQVEYNGMQNLLQSATPHLGANVVYDASSSGQDGIQTWGALDDVVMGGVSQSSFKRSESGNHAVFSGCVSATNNGGFASVRTKNFTPPLDLSDCKALSLRVKGDGLRYKVSVRTDTNWDGIGYTQSFDTKQGEWQDIELPFDQFVPVFRAKLKEDAPAFNSSHVASIQLMLSKFEYNGKLNPNFRLGEFALPVARIKGVPRSSSPKIVHVSSAGVTRPGRPGLDLEKEPPAVRMNEALDGLLTWKLAAENLIRESGIPYTIVRPVALTDEAAGADLEIAQGDNIKGKISRSDVASLCAALLSEDAANTTFEIKSTVPFSQEFQPNNVSAERDWDRLLKTAQLRQDQ